MRNQYRDIEKKIGYRFKKKRHLEVALMHRSFRFENSEVEEDNQRLEFLGDAVLGFLAAAYVYREHDERDEGVLTAFRSQTTSGKALAGLARGLDLGEYLKIGRGEDRSGGRDRSSNLADALESIIGAAYIDGGIKAAEKVFKKVVIPEFEGLSGDVWANNPKGKLQEYAQRTWRKSPQYKVIGKEGPPHNSVFTSEVSVNDILSAEGRGRNKQEAEAVAAENALKWINKDQNDTA